MKKFSFDKDFESVYLRESAIKKIKFTSEHENYLKSAETIRVIKYLSNYHWMKNPHYWSKIGVEKEDLLSMVNIYALYYIGKNFNHDTFNYKNMMRFVGQRLEYYGECFYRKYDMSEIIDEHTTADFEFTVLANEQNDFKTTSKSNKMSKRTKSLLRLKLSKNLKDYENLLAYYAVSKHVGEDVRKKAKKYCKFYGINYKEIAKEKFLNKGFDLHYILD